MKFELDRSEITSKLSAPHLRRRELLVRRLAQLSSFYLLLYALLSLLHIQSISPTEVCHRLMAAVQAFATLPH